MVHLGIEKALMANNMANRMYHNGTRLGMRLGSAAVAWLGGFRRRREWVLEGRKYIDVFFLKPVSLAILIIAVVVILVMLSVIRLGVQIAEAMLAAQ